MPRRGVCRMVATLSTAALLGGCAERHDHSAPLSEPGAGTGVVTAETAARLRSGHYSELRDVAQAVSLPTAFDRAEALHALASRADARMLQDLMDATGAVEDPLDRRLARRILILRYGQLQPDAAARAAAETGFEDAPELVRTLFADWARRDLDRALAALPSFSPDVELQRTAAAGIVDAHSWRGPAHAEALLTRLPAGLRTADLQGEALAMNAARDPADAFERAIALDAPAAREAALLRIVRIWADSDAEQAFLHVNRLADRRLRDVALGPVLQQWAEQDAERVWAEASSEPDPQLRTGMQHAALGVLILEDAVRAFEYAEELDGGARNSAYYMMLSRLASEDPERAADAVLSIDDPAARVHAARSIMGTLASVDIDGALDWAEAVEGQRGGIWLSMLRQAAIQDPLATFNRVSGLVDPTERTRALTAAIRGAAASAPDLAAAYVEELPVGAERDNAIRGLMDGLAGSDPRAAMEFALARPDGERELLQQQMSRVAMSHPDIAEQYVSRLAEKERTGILMTLANRKAAGDPVAAAAWLAGYEGDPDFDRLAVTLAAGMGVSDPDSALGIARRIGDDRLRGHAMARVAGAMARQNPDGAIAIFHRIPQRDRSAGLVSQVVQPVAMSDPRRAEQWIESFDDPALRDSGYAAMASVAANRADLEGSLDYVRRIGSEKAKMRALVPLLLRSGGDPGTVDRILAGVGLSSQVEEELREEIRRRFPMGLTR